MTYFCLKPNQNQEEEILTQSCTWGRRIFSFALLALLMCVGALYLWQTNCFVGQSYNLNQLKKDEQIFKTEEQDLLLALADLRSLKNLKQRTAQLSLVEVQQVSYLSLAESLAAAAAIHH